MPQLDPARRPGGSQPIPRPESWRPGAPAPWTQAESTPISLAAIVGAVSDRPVAPLLPPFSDARISAVLVVLRDGDGGGGGGGPEVLLTRRSMELRIHRGEVSFPGGRLEPGESAVDAALREAWEEVGLDPAVVTVHGELDHLSTAVSRSYIVPVVASVDDRPPLQPQSGEVDRILWVSLGELARADTFREELWGTPPMDRPIFFFELDDETIWGATARMVHQLLRLAHGLDGPEPLAW